jgi:hypothetical protein
MCPSSSSYVRNYAQEAKTSAARGEKPKNASRKAAKRAYEARFGKCSGDVDHRSGNALNNTLSNLRCVSATKNRSFARNSKAGKR